jgi:hypothetical protein
VGRPATGGQADGDKTRKRFKGPVKVFILAGQSNMEGLGGVRTLDALGEHPTHGYLLKKIKKDDGSFVVRDDVFVYYHRAGEPQTFKKPLTVGMGGWGGGDWFGPELMFGIEMGDYYEEPVLLIKTAWGGKDLFYDFRPPSAGKPAYEVGKRDSKMGEYYGKMVEEIHKCLDNLDTDFPQFKGLKYELCGFVWFQGWNDMCSGKKEAWNEYCSNFVHLVQDLRAEFRVPNLPVVVGELGCGGEKDAGQILFRKEQAKIATCPELKGTVGYVRTAPFWYAELDELPRKLGAEEGRVRQKVAAQVEDDYKNKPESSDPKKMEQLVNEALAKALEDDAEYQRVKKEHDRHVSNWFCHYNGSARVYCMVGYSLAEAMKPFLEKK